MIEFHRLILGDKLRNELFCEALKQVIVPGETVVADIGSGTGYLSFVASKLGAKECHLYETSEMLGLSKKLAKENGIGNCRFHRMHSTEEHSPPRCDIVISETLGNYALEENMLETLRDARRFLKPGGVMIPQKLRQFVVPVTSDRIHRELNVWDDLGHGLRFTAAKETCFHNVYVRTLTKKDFSPDLPSRMWDEIDFRDDNDSVREATIEWPVKKSLTVHGFALSWECDLLERLTLSTAADAPRTHWEQIYLPVIQAVHAKQGDTLRLRLRSDTRYEVKVRVQWEVSVGKRVVWRGDMARG